MNNKHGKLIVFDGLDGSGKSTQLDCYENYLIRNNVKYLRIKLPHYDSPSSGPVKMYLSGAFGDNAEAISPYVSSSFFAVDRIASYLSTWKEFYEDGGLIIADRYVSSNIIHQLPKLEKDKQEEFATWLETFEFGTLQLPKPDTVVFFDMDPDVSQKLMSKRYNGDEQKKDIHENNISYLKHCRNTVLPYVEKFGWNRVICFNNDQPRTIQDIHEDVLKVLERGKNYA